MEDTNFRAIKAWADRDGLDHHPSEIHGVVTGWICAGSKLDDDEKASLANGLSVAAGSDGIKVIEALYELTLTGLKDEEFGFRLVLPGDDASVNERTRAVSHWCAGFLAGFGMSGRYAENELSSDMIEVMSDLGRISAVSEEVPEDDENETDLIEIGEYVRMSALLVFTECAGRSVH